MGAVGTVFAAAAGFDVHQGAHLDCGGVVEAAVDRLRGIGELAQGCVINLADFISGPVGTGGIGSCSLDENIGDSVGERCGAWGTLDGAVGSQDGPG